MHISLSPIFSLNINDDLFSSFDHYFSPFDSFTTIFNFPNANDTCRMTQIKFHKENGTLSPMQATSLKIHNAHFTWKANIGSPRELNQSLDRLEKLQGYRQNEPRDVVLADIQAARALVDQAANAFDDIQNFDKKLIKIRNDLRQQVKSENQSENLALIESILTETGKVVLPQELTQANVEAYAKQAKEVLQDCEAKVGPLEKAITNELSIENEKTKAQGNAILSVESPAKDCEIVGPEVSMPSATTEQVIK